jgi:uncharacterized integral membrane protein
VSGTGWRLTAASVLSVFWFVLLNHTTDWPAFLVFLAAVVCGFCCSVIDLILAGLISWSDN